MKELLDTDKAYIAGIIDGEGCLVIRHQNNKRSYYPIIQVCNTDYKMVSYLLTVTGIGSICTGKQFGNRKEYYKWTVAKSVDVYALLDAISPYLITKKERSFLLYKLRDIKSRPVIRKGLYLGGTITPEETIKDLKLLASKMSELNFRGRYAKGVNSVETQNGQYRAKTAGVVAVRCDGQA